VTQWNIWSLAPVNHHSFHAKKSHEKHHVSQWPGRAIAKNDYSYSARVAKRKKDQCFHHKSVMKIYFLTTWDFPGITILVFRVFAPEIDIE